MCIMFIKDFDMAFPSDKTMKICWDDNRDGAGYAWYDNTIDMWHVVKGLMSWTAFLDKFNEDREKYELDKKSVVVHFRVGTSGPEVGGATHPFPAVETEGVTVNTLEYTCKGVFFHNGTVGAGTKELSDTQVATLDYVQPMVPHIFEDDQFNEPLLDILAECLNATGNRYVITHGPNIHYLGSWVKDAETGMVFSNSRYKEENTRYQAAAIKASIPHTTTNVVTTVNGLVEYELIPRLEDVTLFMNEDYGTFDWNKWDNRYTLEDNTTTTTTDKTIETIEVYGADGEVKYTVARDPKDTEAWEDIQQQSPDAPPAGSTTCITCNLFVMPNELVHGECPGCGTILDPDGYLEAKEDQRNYGCPTCDKNMSIEFDGFPEVIKSAKARGLDDFCTCWDCGCVWGYTSKDNRWTLGYLNKSKETDGNTTKVHEEFIPVNTNVKAVG